MEAPFDGLLCKTIAKEVSFDGHTIGLCPQTQVRAFPLELAQKLLTRELQRSRKKYLYFYRDDLPTNLKKKT